MKLNKAIVGATLVAGVSAAQVTKRLSKSDKMFHLQRCPVAIINGVVDRCTGSLRMVYACQ